MRLAPITGLSGQALDFSISADYAPGNQQGQKQSSWTPGTFMEAAPTDGGIDTTANTPNWGLCELVYCVNTSSSTFNPGRLVVLDTNFVLSDLPATANTGRPLYVALTRFAAGNVTRQGGWVLRSGICPVSFSVAATTGAVFGGAAGQATPTAAAGRQILNASTLIAAAGSFTRQIVTQSGSSLVKTARVNGLYLGQAISGTGIPGSSVISAIDPSGTAIQIGSAVGTPVNATATGVVTGTFTHTGFGIVHLDRAFMQGQIT
jgi:hypothetical protein